MLLVSRQSSSGILSGPINTDLYRDICQELETVIDGTLLINSHLCSVLKPEETVT